MPHIEDLDLRHFMSPGPMHLYNFLCDLQDRFMAGVRYIGRGHGELRFEVVEITKDAYFGLLKPLCDKYAVVRCHYIRRAPGVGLANVRIDYRVLRAGSTGFFDAVSLMVINSDRRDIDVWLEMFERQLTINRRQKHWDAERIMQTYGEATVELHTYLPGPHPEILKRVNLEDLVDAKKSKIRVDRT